LKVLIFINPSDMVYCINAGHWGRRHDSYSTGVEGLKTVKVVHE
jgi:hypothetical protein